MLSKLSLLLAACSTVLAPAIASTEETFSAVLERMQVKESLHYRYKETRHLALLALPWNASGELFISPDSMVIAQHSPGPALTKITEHKLLHIDTGREIQRTIKLEQPFGVPGMAPFLQLLYRTSGQAELELHYRTSFKLNQGRWLLGLNPKQEDSGKIHHMELSGFEAMGPDWLKLTYTDGDHTEWRLSLVSGGSDAAKALQQVLDNMKEPDHLHD